MFHICRRYLSRFYKHKFVYIWLYFKNTFSYNKANISIEDFLYDCLNVLSIINLATYRIGI